MSLKTEAQPADHLIKVGVPEAQTFHFAKRGEMPTFTREEQEAARVQLKANAAANQLPVPDRLAGKLYSARDLNLLDVIAWQDAQRAEAKRQRDAALVKGAA